MIFALILAQADPAAQMLKDWISVALYILGAVALILTVLVLWKQYKAKDAEIPNPVFVKNHEDFVLVPIHEKAIAELKAAQAKDIAEIKTELLRHGQRRAEIYRQNEEHGRQIAGLQAETRSITQQMHRMASQIEDLPAKIKTLLLS